MSPGLCMGAHPVLPRRSLLLCPRLGVAVARWAAGPPKVVSVAPWGRVFTGGIDRSSPRTSGLSFERRWQKSLEQVGTGVA